MHSRWGEIGWVRGGKVREREGWYDTDVDFLSGKWHVGQKMGRGEGKVLIGMVFIRVAEVLTAVEQMGWGTCPHEFTFLLMVNINPPQCIFCKMTFCN